MNTVTGFPYLPTLSLNDTIQAGARQAAAASPSRLSKPRFPATKTDTLLITGTPGWHQPPRFGKLNLSKKKGWIALLIGSLALFGTYVSRPLREPLVRVESSSAFNQWDYCATLHTSQLGERLKQFQALPLANTPSWDFYIAAGYETALQNHVPPELFIALMAHNSTLLEAPSSERDVENSLETIRNLGRNYQAMRTQFLATENPDERALMALYLYPDGLPSSLQAEFLSPSAEARSFAHSVLKMTFDLTVNQLLDQVECRNLLVYERALTQPMSAEDSVAWNQLIPMVHKAYQTYPNVDPALILALIDVQGGNTAAGFKPVMPLPIKAASDLGVSVPSLLIYPGVGPLLTSTEDEILFGTSILSRLVQQSSSMEEVIWRYYSGFKGTDQENVKPKTLALTEQVLDAYNNNFLKGLPGFYLHAQPVDTRSLQVAAPGNETSTPSAESVTAAPNTTSASITDPAQYQTYTVKSGDYLLKIARAYNVSLQALIAANGITNPSLIHVGQTLRIPVNGSSGPNMASVAPAVTDSPAAYIPSNTQDIRTMLPQMELTQTDEAMVNYLVNVYLDDSKFLGDNGQVRYAYPHAYPKEEFARTIVRMAKLLNPNAPDLPRYLFATMLVESGINHTRVNTNPRSGATGLIQFMPSTARGLGNRNGRDVNTNPLTTDELKSMSVWQQLVWVYRYFEPMRSNLRSYQDAYLTVYWPAGVGKPSNHVLMREGDNYYGPNAAYDYDDNGVITKDEASRSVVSRAGKIGDNPNLSFNQIMEQFPELVQKRQTTGPSVNLDNFLVALEQSTGRPVNRKAMADYYNMVEKAPPELQDTLYLALSQVGVKGQYDSSYIKSTYLEKIVNQLGQTSEYAKTPNAAWCAYFMSWALRHGGPEGIFPWDDGLWGGSASVPTIWNTSVKGGVGKAMPAEFIFPDEAALPKRGSPVTINGLEHIGIILDYSVSRLQDGRLKIENIVTVEGNMAIQGYPSGTGPEAGVVDIGIYSTQKGNLSNVSGWIDVYSYWARNASR